MAADLTVEEFGEIARAIESEVGKVIVGQTYVVRHVLVAIVVGGHTLLEGVPGLGKTLLVRTLARVLDLDFSRIQFTPDLMPADIIGTDILEESADGHRQFRFQSGPIFANLILADEINRATPKTQSALLEAMQEQTVTVSRETYTLEPPFFVMATQNPIEMEGTYPLPEAQLDRFLFKVNVEFPSESDLVSILERTTGDEEAELSPVAKGEQIVAMGKLARQVPVASHVNEYVASLIKATHPNGEATLGNVQQFVRYGASPRGAQALILGAKVLALMAGRYNVAFEDIKTVAPAALRHRILLNFEGQAEGISTDDIVADILANVAIPAG